MNAAASVRAPAPPEPARAPDAPRRPDSGENVQHTQRSQQFERLLRARSHANDEPDDADPDAPASSEDAPANDHRSSLALFALFPTMHQSLTQSSALPAQQGLPGQPGFAEEGAWSPGQPQTSASQAALQSSLNADPAPTPLGASNASAAGTWEVSVNQPLGAALEMRATRPESASGAEGPAAWTLTIGSSNVDASVLARHAPRLNERLRARAIAHTHVRIEENPGGHDQEPS